MVVSPDGKPLRTRKGGELREMLTHATRNIQYSVKDIDDELKYRDQRRLATVVAGSAGIAIVVNAVGIFLNIVL